MNIVYDIDHQNRIKLYDIDMKFIFKPLAMISSNQRCYDEALKIVLSNNSITKAFLNIKHKYLYMKKFCKIILDSGQQNILPISKTDKEYIKSMEGFADACRYQYYMGLNSNDAMYKWIDSVTIVRKSDGKVFE